jgi:non-ribosomal peptide synthetase component E (peptide arylation enzyme)
MANCVCGEKACAYVILRPNAGITLADIGPFLTERGLAKYKIPELIELTDAFPVIRIGEIDKVRRPGDRRKDAQ